MKDRNAQKIFKNGNSLVVSIPSKLLKQHDLKKGDHVRLDKITKVKINVTEDNTSEQKKLKK